MEATHCCLHFLCFITIVFERQLFFWTNIFDDYGKQVVQRCTEVHPTGGWT